MLSLEGSKPFISEANLTYKSHDSTEGGFLVKTKQTQ